ncbi:MAG TPA: Uma2 family endonuclease [Gemmataceae bacterium]|nr:Uma2 family endonuclease [Gemmataceae bacterium]
MPSGQPLAALQRRHDGASSPSEQPKGLVESIIVSPLAGRIGPHCRESGCVWAIYRTPFLLPTSGNDRKPDVAFVSYQRRPQNRPLPRVNAWPVVPDLAVEVVGPTDEMFDVIEKVGEYFAAGVQQVWLILSHVEQVFVFTGVTQVGVLTRAAALTADPLIPGFRMPLADLFPVSAPAP